ncbi:hypothetical protein F2Q70_00033286 [Brassica cretica]|uniref:Uncharacterized protein n=1 Tax=Brassica cretica TaxID=69181 RepID=A0A8S9FL74_BRACR|nr:hypothetical protein F2Q70_00033286 [Brassica cretica]
MEVSAFPFPYLQDDECSHLLGLFQDMDSAPSGFEFENMDVRSNAIVRAAVDRDKDTMRLANHNAVQGEDRSSIGIDGWEKSKMKKKRSGIKTDGPSSLASNRAVDGYRDLKQGIPKPAGDSRLRLNGDSNMLRYGLLHGSVNGAVPYGRSDSLSRQTGLAGGSLPSRDSDHSSLYNEKRDRAIASDKERVNLRAINKSNIHDESNSSSPKINVTVRGPRSGSGLPPKLSPVVHNTPSPSDWDISGCTNKPPLLSGVPNRKQDSASVNEDLQFDGFGADAESEFSALNHMEFNGYRSDKLEFDELEDDVSVIPLKGVNSSAHIVSGRFTDHLSADFSDIQYETLGIDEKIYLEAQSIGICLEPMANISNVEDEGIVDEIKTLEEAVYEVIANFGMLSILKLKGSKKKEMLNRLLTPALEMKELQEKEFDRLGYEKLIEMAYEKSKASRRHHSASGKSSANKISKQAAFAFMKRTLGRCRQFEETGKSCFSESTFKNILVAGLTQIEDNPTDKEDILSASTPMGSQPSSSLALRIKQNTENYTDSSEHTLREGKDETTWLNRTKERELLLDDVCGTPLSSSTKGKRSDRDRDGKGQASSSRGGGTKKIGRPALSNNAKGERKSKTKPRLKTTPMYSSPSVSILEQNRTSSSKPTDTNNSEYSNLETLDETEPLDLSGLQIPDGLGGPDDLDAQAGDLSSWLNIDDDALQDNDIDLLGLQIPMDDLSDLKMMV